MTLQQSTCKDEKNELHIANKKFSGGGGPGGKKRPLLGEGGAKKVDFARLGVPGGSKKGQNGSTSFMDAPLAFQKSMVKKLKQDLYRRLTWS